MKKLISILLSVLVLVSCSGSEPIAKVGKIKITQGEFEFYLQAVKKELKGTEIQTEEDWQNKEIEGKKAIEIAKEHAMDTAIKNALYIETAKAAGLTLSNDEKNEVKALKKQIEASKGSKSAYNDYLKQNNISDKFINTLCESEVYRRKITEKVKNDTQITDEAKKTYFENNKWLFESNTKKAKHILIATIEPDTYESKSDEEKETAKNLAMEVYQRVQNGENFDKLMNEYSEDPGLKTSPNGYVFKSGQMVSEFEDAVESISDNQITICESDFGYHIIKRLPLSYEDVATDVANKHLEHLIDEQVEKWQKDFSVEITRDEKMLADIK